MPVALHDAEDWIAAGYMAKHVAAAPAWGEAAGVRDICAVSPCLSVDFADYIGYWRHNGYWLFNDPADIAATRHDAELAPGLCTLFYYEFLRREYVVDGAQWRDIRPTAELPLDVTPPLNAVLLGYDVVCYSTGTAAECSPLSCNGLANEHTVNQHCLLDTASAAVSLIDSDALRHAEPGPYRVAAVYNAVWP